MNKKYLKNLLTYVSSVYKIGKKINRLQDKRKNKKIKTATIAFVLLIGFMLKIRSFNQLDDWLENEDFKKLVPRKTRMPRIDAIRDSLKLFGVEGLVYIQDSIIKESRDNKLFRTGTIDGYKVAAFDGVELFESRNKSCKNCLTRIKSGETHYFHRSVVCAYVGKDPHLVIGQEMLKPHKDSSNKDEGELTAAKRLMKNLYKKHHHFADVIVTDALYCNAPWLNTVMSCDMDAVIRVKDERLNIVKDAMGLFKNREPDKVWEVEKNKKTKIKISAWSDSDIDMSGMSDTVRFVRFKELVINLETGEFKENEVWIVTTNKVISVETLWQIIHRRWGIENNIFHQLKTEWHMNHCFIHDETGIEAVLMFMIISFNLMQLFFFRRLKDFRKKRLLQVEVVERIIKEMIIYEADGKYLLDTG